MKNSNNEALTDSLTLIIVTQKVVGGFVGGFNKWFQFFTFIGCHSLSFWLENNPTPSVLRKPS